MEKSKLDKDITTHVLIIGGGLAGVLCAYIKGANINAVKLLTLTAFIFYADIA